jgi:hypothetical protein
VLRGGAVLSFTLDELGWRLRCWVAFGRINVSR